MISENQGEDKIDSRLFRDLTDNLSFEQSMRSFNSTPNTRIPNDQTAFAEYCYGNMISCRGGDEVACARNISAERWIDPSG